ncbi:hypothetical protein [Rubrivirga marina]|uniref:Uncharacterized protein n=1 Tax=Rubrivirga marina TaxID=1196024 RepID=A0A271IZI2_9BACT|nr:hypothetical protein [Rubrivirga marina]PAP76646.1 hypothetical protein BSZ37_09420 [Rubrivirga marina]
MPSSRLGALAALLALTACDSPATGACTLIGCADAYSVTLAPAGDVLTPGRYAVEASADGETESCAFTVSADAGQTDISVSGESEGCQGLFAFMPSTDAETRVRVVFSPLADDVTIRVRRDGADLASVRVDPVYVDQYPNGPDCGAVCRQADTTVRVP